MRHQPDDIASSAEARALLRRFPTYAEYVDDALFHPDWGYYSRGNVQFGDGGHYDTYPLALSPMFGRMVAEYAFRLWRRHGRPARFEICELGAGNGQLCLDTVLWIQDRAGRHRGWRAFRDASSYRIVERSPALIARQRQQLGPLATVVQWSRGDLSRSRLRTKARARHGLLVANEVLDCLPHHKVVPRRGEPPAAVVVIAERNGRRLDRAALAGALARGQRLRWREVLVPATAVPGLSAFLARHYPELCAPRRRLPPYFACPRIEVMLRNAADCFAHGDAIWIDYGALRDFQLSAPENRKVFAGPPRSRQGVFDDPGRQDVTFMVDFSVAETAARATGWRVLFNGPQAELARRSGVHFDDRSADVIVEHRALTWMLALLGRHPEHSWRRGAVSWARGAAAGKVSVRRYVEGSIREFLGQKPPFRVLITRRD